MNVPFCSILLYMLWYLGMHMLSAVGTTLSADGYRCDPLSGLLGEPQEIMGQAYPRHTDHHRSSTSLAVQTFTKCSFSSKAKSWDARQSQDDGETVDGSLCQWPTATSRLEMQIFTQGSISAPSKQNVSCSIQRSSSRPHQCPHKCPPASSRAACQAQALGPRMVTLCRCGETLRFECLG